jgi:hypothetical protein
MRILPSFATAAPCTVLPGLVLLASCVGPAPRGPSPGVEQHPARLSAPARHAPAPTPQPASPLAPLQPAEWNYRPIAPGNWTYHGDAVAPSALFGPSAAAPLLTIRCDRAARRIGIIRTGAGPDPGQGVMTIRTSYGAQSWPATVTPTQTIAVRAASDAALDQIAYSRGKVMVEVPGLAPLVVPSWAEISRVIEDCRG